MKLFSRIFIISYALILSSPLKAAPEVGGWLEARPTYQNADAQFRTENEVGISLRAFPSVLLSYVQEFQTVTEQGFVLGDGYLKTEAGLISDAVFALDHESRWYVPTNATNREAGFLTALRNDFKMSTPLVENVRLGLWEIPILFAYGQETATNPVFENQVQLMFLVTAFGERLNIKTPLVHQWTRNRVEWAHSLKWNPEATYRIYEKTSLGASYWTPNLINGEGSFGYVQLILNQGI